MNRVSSVLDPALFFFRTIRSNAHTTGICLFTRCLNILFQLYYLFMHPISLQIDFSNYVYLFSMMAYQNVFFTLKIGSYRCMTNLKFFAPRILVGWNILSRFIRFTRKFRHAVHFNGCFENFV